jgi:CRP/FNR family cyclic AMP-dependent transcriptional regulator
VAENPRLFRIISLFEELSEDRLRAIASICQIVSYKNGVEVLSEQDQTKDVFFILQGSVRINSVTSAGREVIFSDLFAGDIFGEFAAIDHLPRSASVIATMDCLLARMTSAQFIGLLREDGAVSSQLVELLVAKIRRLSERVFEVSALSLRERVRRELIRLATLGTPRGSSVVISPAPTHYEFAARIGSHREAVTREFNRLEDLGILELGRQQIRIIRLRALSDPDEA